MGLPGLGRVRELSKCRYSSWSTLSGGETEVPVTCVFSSSKLSQLQGNSLPRQKAANSLGTPENLGIGFFGQGEAVSYQQTYEMLVKGGVDYANVGQKLWGGFWNSLSFGKMTSWNKHRPRRCSGSAFAWPRALSARSSLPWVQLPEHPGGIPHLLFCPVL